MRGNSSASSLAIAACGLEHEWTKDNFVKKNERCKVMREPELGMRVEGS